MSGRKVDTAASDMILLAKCHLHLTEMWKSFSARNTKFSPEEAITTMKIVDKIFELAAAMAASREYGYECISDLQILAEQIREWMEWNLTTPEANN